MNAVKMLGISVSDVLPTVDHYFCMIFTQFGLCAETSAMKGQAERPVFKNHDSAGAGSRGQPRINERVSV